jgi:hypothetical protein
MRCCASRRRADRGNSDESGELVPAGRNKPRMMARRLDRSKAPRRPCPVWSLPRVDRLSVAKPREALIAASPPARSSPSTDRDVVRSSDATALPTQEREDAHGNQRPAEGRPYALEIQRALQKVHHRTRAPPAHAHGAASANPDRTVRPIRMLHQVHVADGPSAPIAISFRLLKVYFAGSIAFATTVFG